MVATSFNSLGYDINVRTDNTLLHITKIQAVLSVRDIILEQSALLELGEHLYKGKVVTKNEDSTYDLELDEIIRNKDLASYDGVFRILTSWPQKQPAGKTIVVKLFVAFPGLR